MSGFVEVWDLIVAEGLSVKIFESEREHIFCLATPTYF
jgi:hypothetical protein